MTATQIICVKVPVRLESELNQREHHMARHRRLKSHREAGKKALGGDIKGPPPPYVITLTRIAPRELDSGNLEASFKGLQDGVADWLGIDDGDKRLTWRYAQRKGAPREYAAEIAIESSINTSPATCTKTAAESTQGT